MPSRCVTMEAQHDDPDLCVQAKLVSLFCGEACVSDGSDQIMVLHRNGIVHFMRSYSQLCDRPKDSNPFTAGLSYLSLW